MELYLSSACTHITVSSKEKAGILHSSELIEASRNMVFQLNIVLSFPVIDKNANLISILSQSLIRYCTER